MNTTVKPDLDKQIEEARRSIASDGYPMSIGELTNLYRDKELQINPNFQRLFRWTNTQKSRLIESILLGIPLPSIFVAQTESGTWELVDGLQRVSTILELQGELLDKQGLKKPLLALAGTKYLPALDGKCWMHSDETKSLTEAQRLDIKRSKIDIKIIKRGSSPEAKFDLFQRLNSYGSELTAQETRSALLVAAAPTFYEWLEELAVYPKFKECVSLNEADLDERFDLDLALRFLVLHNWPTENLTLSSLKDFPQVLDEESVALARQNPNGSQSLREVFTQTFDILHECGGEDVFRRWDAIKGEFKGPFLLTSFEVFGLGLGHLIRNGIPRRSDIKAAVQEFWNLPQMKSKFATGQSTERRMVQFVPMGRNLLKAPPA